MIKKIINNMEKINIAELLKDCPKGMELDCTMYENLSYDYVNEEQNRIYCKVDLRDTVWFTIYGCVNLSPNAKCVIFPKGKNTWDGFHRPFVEGDIVSTESGMFIGIVKSTVGSHSYHTFCSINGRGGFFIDNILIFSRFATEEEKQKLFDAIKANGYRWNAETKTLEKLIEPKFKVGDRIRHKEITSWACTIVGVGDRYYVDGHPTCFTLLFGKQDEYELVPNKFDINTLVPFESRVLVRDNEGLAWRPAIFGMYKPEIDKEFPYIVVGGTFYTQCIPFKDNEHLLGTTNDCDDFYKTWEK